MVVKNTLELQVGVVMYEYKVIIDSGLMVILSMISTWDSIILKKQRVRLHGIDAWNQEPVI